MAQMQQIPLGIIGNQQAITVQPQQPTNGKREKYRILLFRLGIVELILGGMSVLLAMLAIIIAATNQTIVIYGRRYYYIPSYTYTAQGVWCGAFTITTGILALRVKKNASVCMYNTNMTLSIITASVMLPFISMSGMAAQNSGSLGIYQVTALTAVHAVLLIVGIATGVVCVTHSVFCCVGVCCKKTQGVKYAPQSYQMATVPIGQFPQPATSIATLAPVQTGMDAMYKPQQGNMMKSAPPALPFRPELSSAYDAYEN